MSAARKLGNVSADDEHKLREGARLGDDVALQLWADWLEEHGRDGPGAALRGLVSYQGGLGLRDALKESTRRYFRYLCGRRRPGGSELRLFAAAPHGAGAAAGPGPTAPTASSSSWPPRPAGRG